MVVISKSMTVKGDIGAIHEMLIKKVTELGFTESSTIWPTDIEFKRGKKGLFARNLKEVKTVLKVSLNQVSDNVNILFEYNFHIPSAYVNKDDDTITQEFTKIKFDLSGMGPLHRAAEVKTCDVCLNPIGIGENFCRNCGRSANRQKVEPVNPVSVEQNVNFDPVKVLIGQKVVDDALYGGIPKNSVMLITSPACEELDLIVTRFMETGLDQSEIVVYVSSNYKMANNQKAVKSQEYYQVICNPQADLVVSDSNTNNTVKVMGVERLTELSVGLTTLLNNISKNTDTDEKPKRLVLDVLSDVLLSNQSVNTRKWLRETITKFKSKNFTILAMLNPYMHSKEETHALLDLFDGQVDLYEKENQGNSRIFMRVKRLNNSRYSTKEIELIRENLLLQDKI